MIDQNQIQPSSLRLRIRIQCVELVSTIVPQDRTLPPDPGQLQLEGEATKSDEVNPFGLLVGENKLKSYAESLSHIWSRLSHDELIWPHKLEN